MDVSLRNLCVNDVTVLSLSLFNSDSIADARFVRKMADKHINIVKYTKLLRENCNFPVNHIVCMFVL